MTKPEFEVIGIQNYLRGNEDTLHICLPLIRNKHKPEEIYFVSRHSWVNRLDPDYSWVSEQESAKTFHPVAKDETGLVGSTINPPRTILSHQSVAQAGPGLLKLVKQLSADKFELLFADFFDIEQGFKGKVLYMSDYEELTRQIIDLGTTVFDRELERTQGNRLSTPAKTALELFRHIITDEDGRLKAMALRLYVADMITQSTTFQTLAQFYEQECRYNNNELRDLAQKKYREIYEKPKTDASPTKSEDTTVSARKALSKQMRKISEQKVKQVENARKKMKPETAAA